MPNEKTDKLKEEKENVRNAKPYSLHPFKPEEALRRIMSAPPPKDPTKNLPKKKP